MATKIAVSYCISCNAGVKELIGDSLSATGWGSLFAAFIVLGILVVILMMLSLKNIPYHNIATPKASLLNPIPLTMAAVILGIGAGGFIDGIVFHQILQWHNMLSVKLPPTGAAEKSVNMFWDGIFHIVTLITVLSGIYALWKISRRPNAETSAKLLFGGMLMGWGLFNLVEGTINHHLLGLHNVRENVPDAAPYNYGFLGISLLLIFIGAYIVSGYYKSLSYLLKF